MAQKKLMLLGGIRYLLPVIEAAHHLGYYVITVDYIPDNIAHRYADEYHNVSITNGDAVLTLAQKLHIDGIMSFGVDPGVVTAAYVAHKMGLPAPGPYQSVQILQNKGLFRQFLHEHNFNVPTAKSYTDPTVAINDLSRFLFPVIVKPTDSAGSKGVSRVDRLTDMDNAIHHAISNSLSHSFIIEDFIEKQGFSSDSDSFVVDGKFKVLSFSSQRFDNEAANPYTPAAYSFPSDGYMPSSAMHKCELILADELQRLIHLLQMGTSIYNIETRLGKDGKPYIMEVSPRGGGNRLAEMFHYATGTDMITAAVKASVGEKVEDIMQQPYKGYWAEVILHSENAGIFQSLTISNALACHVIETDLWVKPGDKVNCFNGANDAIGTLVLRFDSKEELEEAMSKCNMLIRANIK